MRGRGNVVKRVLLQAAAFNLALILRSITKAGTPKGLADLKAKLILTVLRILDALPPVYTLNANPADPPERSSPIFAPKLHPPAKLRSNPSKFSYCRKRVF